MGAGNGVSPAIIASSRSHVATATGRTSASPSDCREGAATSCHSSVSGPVHVSERIAPQEGGPALASPAENQYAIPSGFT